MALGSCSTAASCSRLVDENAERTRFFDRRSKAGIDLAAAAITLGRQTLNGRAADGLRARFRLPLSSGSEMSQGVNPCFSSRKHNLKDALR